MLKAIQIKKSYGNLEVLKGIDLEVKKGEMVSIVGSSGAGKTSLLQILGTLDRYTFGKLIINDTDIDTLTENQLSEFRNKSIGFVFQFHHLLPEFSAIENVCIPAFISKKPKKKTEERAKELLDFLELSHRLYHKPSELSGGEQQRVAVARALINYPKIILADEPSGNLDSVSAQQLRELFFNLREEFNSTFVIVTHNPEWANSTDRKLFINDGKISKSTNYRT